MLGNKSNRELRRDPLTETSSAPPTTISSPTISSSTNVRLRHHHSGPWPGTSIQWTKLRPDHHPWRCTAQGGGDVVTGNGTKGFGAGIGGFRPRTSLLLMTMRYRAISSRATGWQESRSQSRFLTPTSMETCPQETFIEPHQQRQLYDGRGCVRPRTPDHRNPDLVCSSKSDGTKYHSPWHNNTIFNNKIGVWFTSDTVHVAGLATNHFVRVAILCPPVSNPST